MALAWPAKDPQEVLDYSVDWEAWLAGDTIDTSTFAVPTGLTKDSEANTDTISTVWLSGGTDGQSYLVINTITTAGGRTGERTVKLKVKSR